MAAATEDRGVFVNELKSSIFHEHPLASDEVIYENTLTQINSSGEVQSLTHSAGDDDSGVTPLVALDFYDEDKPYQDHTHYDRGSTDPRAKVFSDVIVEFDNDDADLTGYSLFGEVYAVDDSTVSASQADGSAGSYAPVGVVYEIEDSTDTVKVLVEGIRQ